MYTTLNTVQIRVGARHRAPAADFERRPVTSGLLATARHSHTYTHRALHDTPLALGAEHQAPENWGENYTHAQKMQQDQSSGSHGNMYLYV